MLIVRKPVLVHAHATRKVGDGDQRTNAECRKCLAYGGIAFSAIYGITVEASDGPSPSALRQLIRQCEIARGDSGQAQPSGGYRGGAQVRVSERGPGVLNGYLIRDQVRQPHADVRATTTTRRRRCA